MLTTLIVVMTVALVMVAGLVALRLAMHSPKIYRGPALDPYELALLAGGRFRVANTALASLATRGALRASPDGRLTLADPGQERSPRPPEAEVAERSPRPPEAEVAERSPRPPEAGWSPHPLEAEILALLGAGRDDPPVWEVKAALVHGPAVAALIGRLEELGLADTGDGARAEPTRLGQAALAHYRLRHREEVSLPPRARDHISREEIELSGIALYGLGRMKDRRLASLLSTSGTPPPSAPPGREPPAPPSPDVPSPSGPLGRVGACGPSGSPDVPPPSGPPGRSDACGPSGSPDGGGRDGGGR
ncbi:TIGR04222 domain-containing membrane protein [Streptosporangium roseum]|uniref:TIGR04222 domain-containing membrane protein n=1 Tax=Streptosporangium roseum TaxID=2001 RepID=UPI0033177F79